MNTFFEYFNKPLLKVPLLFGLLTGVLAFFYFLGLYLLNVSPLGNVRTPDFGIHIILVCYACWHYRKKYGQGWMHLWEGLTIGYVINMTAAFVTGWLIYLFVSYIDPQVFQNYLQEMQDLLLSKKTELVEQIGEEEFGVLLNKVKENQPSTLITDEISKKFMLGIIPILLISLFFRRQQPQR
ncbi:hypothetical protein GCM10023091_41290 [Ravibacter arvi]|uniref:DUF4199 domain-containing protein n=1 Tax=Ravibacter arvi TaxID=2051041 RepID=A0ABP8MC62_9BACT